MSLESQLKELRKQKREEIKSLHVTYLHTKRDLRHNVSPNRLIRRHLGASLGIAAVAGLLLAPRRGGSGEARETKHRKGRGMFPGWAMGLLRTYVPQLAKHFPQASAAAETADKADKAAAPDLGKEHESSKRKAGPSVKGLVGPMILEIVMMVLKKIDVQRLVTQLVQNMTKGRHEGPEETPEGGEPGPQVAVGDGGAIADPEASR